MPDNNTTAGRCYMTNENPKAQSNNPTSYGIVQSSLDPSNILDQLTERGAQLRKLGSSMPTPMARLFLFSAALREVNNLESNNPKMGHIGILNEDNQELEPTPYHDLVGELLDMLEFTFKYGIDIEVDAELWDPAIECERLEESGVAGHRELASALRSAFDFGQLRNQKVYLFKWNDDVIGGTSPITLVYTSANLRTIIHNKNLDFAGDAGNKLFSDNPWPLHQRDEAFREYLYRLRLSDFRGITPGDPINNLADYIRDSAANYDTELNNRVSSTQADPNASIPLTDNNGGSVTVKGIKLLASKRRRVIDQTTSDYILQPTVTRYKHGVAGAMTPMALTPQGVDGLKYAVGRKWSTATDVIPSVLVSGINQRTLPGLSVTYPYVTISDFLEDKIIEVSYQLNQDKFFTGSNSPTSFLLPLKPLFFEFFELSDLINGDGSFTSMLTMSHNSEHQCVLVDLVLPLVNGHTITFHKKYDVGQKSNEKVDCYNGDNTFDLSVFPFYRLTPVNPGNDQNCYQVMVGSTVEDLSVKFYEPAANALSEVTTTQKLRTLKGQEGSLLNTMHVSVPQAFSMVQLKVGNTGAMLLPIFKQVNSDPSLAPRYFSFGIDFGTTNTHVSYAVVNSPTSPIGNDNVNPFEYGETDTQLATLHNDNGTVDFSAFDLALRREFVPFSVGQGGSVKFPMRTTTYQVAGTPSQLKMFFDSNIGFNYGEDLTRSEFYKTNIKWDRQDNLATDRMETFFAQMLWMMKNKSVLNGGSNRFGLVVTYPISMRQNDIDNMKDAWNNAKRITNSDVNIVYLTESVAPYYSHLARLSYGEPYVNMDIGGGTTDIIYINPKLGEYDVFSAFFAANDLWNDGLDPSSRASKANGFVKFYLGYQAPKLGDRRTNIEGVLKNNDTPSEDIISYLFTNDSWSRLSQTIKNSPVMKQLLVVHYSALSFYLAYALHVAENEPPTQLSFTGMGSKYIKLLSSNNDCLSDLLNAIFHYVGVKFNNKELENVNVKVTFAPNPKELTATGALISRNYNHPINPDETVYLGYEGENPRTTFRYKDLTATVKNKVIELFNVFLDVFNEEEVSDALTALDCYVSPEVIDKLRDFASSSYDQMQAISSRNQQPIKPQKEPMFFWPLKNSLYEIGKIIAQDAINDLTPTGR